MLFPTDDHARVGDEDVLQTANNGGGEGRVVAFAEDHGEYPPRGRLHCSMQSACIMPNLTSPPPTLPLN